MVMTSALLLSGAASILRLGVQIYYDKQERSQLIEHHNHILQTNRENYNLDCLRTRQININSEASAFLSQLTGELDVFFSEVEKKIQDKAYGAAIDQCTTALERIDNFINSMGIPNQIQTLERQLIELNRVHQDTSQTKILLEERKYALRSLQKIKLDFIFKRALIYSQGWNYIAAANNFSTAIQLNKDLGIHRFNLYKLRGIAELRGKFDSRNLSAIEDFETCLKYFPDDILTNGRLTFAKCDYKKTIDILEGVGEGLKKRPDLLEEIEEYIADSYFALKNWDAAVEHYGYSLEADRQLPESDKKIESLYVKMGDICFSQNKKQEALVFYKKANEIISDNPLIHAQEALDGNVEWQYKIGMFYLNNAISKDYEKALFWLIKVAKDSKIFSLLSQVEQKRRIDASYQVGLIYLKGNNQVRQSLPEALPYLRYVADNSASPEQVAEAAYEVGILYKNGAEGIPVSVNDAIHQLKKVADAPNAPSEKKMNANIYLGSLYLAVNNFAEARAYSKKAVNAGRVEAQADFISATLQIAESSQDKNRVIGNYIEASDLGDAKASFRLGMIYKNGEGGVRVNLNEAQKYLQKAKVKNYPGAAEQLATDDFYISDGE